VAPDTNITVVTHANGVDFLMEGAKDAKDANIDYGSLVSALKARGVTFEICEITLRNRNLKKEQFNMDATFTPSGVVRIGRLQSRENFAYIKPGERPRAWGPQRAPRSGSGLRRAAGWLRYGAFGWQSRAARHSRSKCVLCVSPMVSMPTSATPVAAATTTRG
jgi:intracellular sulfur oxidation DsrE/DsrF family protein